MLRDDLQVNNPSDALITHFVGLSEALVLYLADPPSTQIAVESHVSFKGTLFALIGVIGFRDGHYTAISHRALVCTERTRIP